MLGAMLLLQGCAALQQKDPLNVAVAGIEPLQGQGLELRLEVKLRVQNPNDASITYDGISAEVDLNGRSFATGVSDASGEIPRFGESVIELPLTVPATAIVRQVLGLFTGDNSKANYRVRGFLHTGTFGRQRFDSTGEIDLPKPAPSGN